MSDVPLGGTVEPRFELVREVFERNFDTTDELGAAVCVYLDGRKVVDLWGGWADAARTREWEHDTIVTVYSATKGLTATCAHRLVDRGLLDVDERVATYWPEFAAAGKDAVTVRMLLSHQAGLPWLTEHSPPPELRFDWDVMTDALARSRPLWEPGTRSEYHGGTFGFLAGELVRRVDGRPLDVFFREEIGEPLGVDFFFRFGPELDDRCAEMVGDDGAFDVNSRAWRTAGDGAATGHGTAESLARVFAALAGDGSLDGVEVLTPPTIDAAVQEQPIRGGDPGACDFGLGYQLLWKTLPFGPLRPFGHTGMGGSIGLADRENRLGIGYAMNRLHSGGSNTLVPAIYGAVLSSS